MSQPKHKQSQSVIDTDDTFEWSDDGTLTVDVQQTTPDQTVTPNGDDKHNDTPKQTQISNAPAKTARKSRTREGIGRQDNDSGAATVQNGGDPVEVLTPDEIQVVHVLCDASTAGLTTQQRADCAGVSVDRWYRMVRLPRVQAAVQAMLPVMLTAHGPAVINAAVQSAMLLGKGGHGDRKELLARLMPAAQKHEHKHAHVHDIGQRLEAAVARREAALARGPVADVDSAEDLEPEPIGPE